MRKLFIKNPVIVAVSVIMPAAYLFVMGCASSKNPRTAAVDKHYQQILEQQQRKSLLSEETDIERKLHFTDESETFEQMGDAYLRQNNPGMAFIEYSKALKIKPDRTRTREKLGYLLLKRGMWANAISEFDTILGHSPNNTVALQGKGTALLQLNRLKEAEQCLTAAMLCDSRLWQAQALLGTIYDRQKLHEPAIEAYRKAIIINPKATAVYNDLGVSLYLNGQYRESADMLLKAISLNAANPATYNNLGLTLFKMGMFSEACESFKKGGDEASAYNNMGFLFMEIKDYTKAVQFFEKAIEAKPSYYENAHAGLQKAKSAIKAHEEKPDSNQDSDQPR